MAKPKHPLLSMRARGTIASSLTFQKRGQQTIVRKKPIPTDPQTDLQLAQRQKYRDAVNAWHALSQEDKEAWRGVCPGLTAYQCFMRSELQYVAPTPPPEEYTEDQTFYDMEFSLSDYHYLAVGQKLTIPNREVTKLGFWLRKDNSPTMDVYARIRKLSDHSIYREAVIINATALDGAITYYEATFSETIILDEVCYITCEVDEHQSPNTVQLSATTSDVKEDENLHRNYDAAWSDIPTWDCAYRYKYYEV